VNYLVPLGYDITVFTRKRNNVLLDEAEHIHIRELYTTEDYEKFDVVVNLAYPSSFSRKKNFQSNKDIVSFIKKISGKETVIIHASTIAVFGTSLDYPIKRTSISFRRDHPYTEVKIHMENLLQQEMNNTVLHIIRLGNVWGPGSPSWLNSVADRLVYNEPILEKAKEAPSNIAYIANVCDFIHCLSFDKKQKAGIHFHHFADFGAIKWGEILDRIGLFLGEKPVYMPFQVVFYSTFLQEIKQIIAPIIPKSIFYKMLDMRRLSSFAKSIVDMVPAKSRMALKAYPVVRIVSRDTKDIVFSNRILFEHHLDSDWQSKYSFEEALAEVRSSLETSGYLIKDGQLPS